MSPSDNEMVLWIASGLGVAVMALGKAAWDTARQKIDEARLLAETKADAKELDRVRNHQADIFKLIREHEAEDRQRHEQLLDRINTGQQQILERLDQRRNRRD